MNHRILFTIAAAGLLIGCGRDETPGAAAAPVTVATLSEHVPVHVDSILPIEEELRRFRAGIAEAPATLGGEWHSRDALVAHFIGRLEAADSAAFAAMLITQAEFAYLYYPHTRYVEKPYELAPSLLWFNMTNATSKGLSRALRLAGRDLRFDGYSCASEPESAGAARLWTGCRVSIQPDGEERMSTTLFGAIIERDGRFRFLSYANSL